MAAVESTADVLDDRDVAALTEKMTTLDDVGPAKDAPDIYVVVSQSGASYTVDAREGRCECPDAFWRGRECKHVARVAFAVGAREIPDWVNTARVDPQLGQHVTGGDQA